MTLIPLEAVGSTYESINGGVHRRAASIVGVPSLIRHIGLWNVPPETACAQGAPVSRETAFYRYLKNLSGVITGDKSGFIQFDEKDLPQIDPTEKVRSGTIRLIRFWWHGMRTTIRVEFRTEYIMVTSILDLSPPEKFRNHAPADPENPLRKAKRVVDELGALFDSGPPDNELEREELKGKFTAIARTLQYELWKAFEGSVLDAELNGVPILGRNLGEVFADFRGILTGSTVNGVVTPIDNAIEGPILSQTFRKAFKLERRGERTRPLEHRPPVEGWDRDSLKRIWPLVESEDYLRDFEFTVSGFLEGRALFVTALGPKLPPEKQEDCHLQWSPVCNFIHTYTDDEWQLGRLVDRIMNLGTLRLAATVEIEHLIDVGADVDDLTAAIRSAELAIENEINEERKRNDHSSKPAKNSDDTMDDVRRLLNDINENVSNDILYRLERSEYYVEQFMSVSKTLRVKRVEGFQQYDEIVARRMSGIFGYIQLLRRRMFDVDARMTALNHAYTALKAVRTDRKIEKIQEFGEIALIGALIPYYLGAAIFHYAYHLEGAAGQWPWLVMISAGAIIVTIRGVFRKRSILNASYWLFICAAYLAAVLLAVPTFWPSHPTESNQVAENNHLAAENNIAGGPEQRPVRNGH